MREKKAYASAQCPLRAANNESSNVWVCCCHSQKRSNATPSATRASMLGVTASALPRKPMSVGDDGQWAGTHTPGRDETRGCVRAGDAALPHANVTHHSDPNRPQDA